MIILSVAVCALAAQDITVSPDRIGNIVAIDQYAETGISFRNVGSGQARLTFDIDSNLTGIVKLDRSYLDIVPGDVAWLNLRVFGKELGDYNGFLAVREADIKIPIRVKVYDPEATPVSSFYMDIETEKDLIHPGEAFRYKLNLYNVLIDNRYNVTISYKVSLLNNGTPGATLENASETLEVKTVDIIEREIYLPKEASIGNYVIELTAQYMNMNSSASKLFSVDIPFYQRKVLWFPLWYYAVLLCLILIMMWLARIYKAKKEKSKRYHTPVEHNLLPKPGPRSGYLGKIAETERKTYINLDQLTTHAIVAGSTGGGKTVAAQDIVEEALLKGIAVIVFDPTAQWSGMLRKCENENMLTMYPKFGMSPNDARAFNGNVRAITDARQVIDLKKFLKPGEINIFTVNTLDPKDIDTFVANTVSQVFHANFPEEPQLKYLFVYDEVHRLLPKFGGSGEGFIQIERACREFRKWGIGMLLISQVLADFVGQIKANINTEIQMRTRDEGDLKRIATKYGKDLLQSLVKASIGSGMLQNAEYNRGKPYFVSFRPMMHSVRRLSDEVLQTYNKYNDMIDDIEYQLEQLEKDGVDIFDMKLELKLALDKVKSGSFNMVDIYLDGLRPKLEKEWAKLGKKPKKLQVTLIKDDILKQDMLKAEQERSKLVLQEATKAQQVVAKEPLFSKNFKPFTFDNGAMVSTLQELLDVLPTMDEQIFSYHFKGEKNDLPAWINGIDTELGKKAAGVASKQGLVQALAEEKKKNKVYEEQKAA